MSEIESKPETVLEPVAVKVEVVETAATGVPEAMKADVEKIVKDVLKAAIKELLDELKKSPLSKLDKDGDGVISAAEVKEAVTEQAQKLGCGPTCSIA
jgi:hypothetical protein